MTQQNNEDPIHIGVDPASGDGDSTMVSRLTADGLEFTISNLRMPDFSRLEEISIDQALIGQSDFFRRLDVNHDFDHREGRFDVSDYTVVELESHEQALKLTKHCGWCTGNTDNDHYDDFYRHGRLWVFYKPSGKRPSYQLFISDRGSIEFRKKGNVAINPWRFAELNPSVKDFMTDVLPFEDIFRVKGRRLRYISTPTISFDAAYGVQWPSPEEMLGIIEAESVKRATHHKAKKLDRLSQRNIALKQKSDLFKQHYG